MRHTPYIAPMTLITLIVLASVCFELTRSTEVLQVMYGWYDKIQHFTAGIVCGIFGVWCVMLYHCNTGGHPSQRALTVGAICAALLIGGLWEVYEHLYQYELNSPHSYTSLDTILDMICDTAGAIVTSMFYRARYTHLKQ